MRLVSKISNLCDPDPPTSQTDGLTGAMQSQYCALQLSASRGKNYKVSDNVRLKIISTAVIQTPYGTEKADKSL